MNSVTVTAGLMDWQVIQQENGIGYVVLEGSYDADKPGPIVNACGVSWARPIARVVSEQSGLTVVPWTAAQELVTKDNCRGTYRMVLEITVGGPYRVETAMEARASKPDTIFTMRGDVIFHVCVGDIFVIAGQSNATGYGTDYCTDGPMMGVHMLRNRNTWDIAVHPLSETRGIDNVLSNETGVAGASPFLSFGKTYYELTGIPVGLIQTAYGGTSMNDWSPDGALYAAMIERIERIQKKIAGVFWYQGCGDAGVELAKVYLEKFRKFVAAVRERVGYEVPFFTCQLNRVLHGSRGEGWGMLREVQRQATKQIPGVYVMTTMNLGLSDAIHNNAASNVVLGQRLGSQCAHVLQGKAPYAAPDFRCARLREKEGEIWVDLELENVQICLFVDGMQSFVDAFTVEDAEGQIQILSVRHIRSDGDTIHLKLERRPGENAVISHAWQAAIVQTIVDETTRLPILSFYRQPICTEEM